jgi:AraC-like DNA-binding protein
MPVDDAGFAPTRFSTDAFSEAQRLPRWREEFGRALVGVDIEPLYPERPFQAEAVMRALPGVRVALSNSSAAYYERTRGLAAESDGSIGMIVNLGPTAAASQLGESLELSTGDAAAVLTEQAGKLTGTGHLGILLPRDVLASRVDDLDSAVMRLIPSSTEPLRLLVSYLKLVQAEVMLATPELRQAVVSHIHDLVALALGANRNTRESGLGAVVAARLAAALADINRSFTEPGLTLAAVALRQGVSPRYLQRLFEESGMSFTARVNEMRLQRAFALLNREHNRGRPISEIAWQAGFSNVSHFNRLFRARFGDTPTGIRA